MDDICDTHFHIFGAAGSYPMVSTRSYDPPAVSVADYESLFGPLGVRRMVLIQPSCYGTDNRCMLEALAPLGARGRAVVAVAPDISDAELQRMHAMGARGIRVNAVAGSTLSIGQLQAIAPRLRELGWHVQTFVPGGRLPALADDLLATGLPLVLDHFGSPDPSLGLEQPTMRVLARMLETGRCWVKFAAMFRVSKAGAPYQDLVPYARALIELRPDRMVWGSDWPYIHFADKVPPDFDPLAFARDALRDPAQLKAVLSDNSRELYDFP